MRRVHSILVAAFAWSCACSCAPAQEDDVQKRRENRIFAEMTLNEALDESTRSKRLLVVYPRGVGEAYRRMDETTWRSPTLREWMLWHGIAVKVDMLDNPDEFRMLRARGAPVGGQKPVVLVFKDGDLVLTIPDPRFFGFRYDPVSLREHSHPPGLYPTMLEVLMSLDVYMDGLVTTDPVWLLAHQQRNPMPPPPPPPPPLFEIADDNAGAFHEPEPEVGGAVDVLAVLEEARECVRTESLYDATGRYTWLWERGVQIDPAFGPARDWLVAHEMTHLAARREASRARFTMLRDRSEDRQPWWKHTDMHEWVVLNRVIGDAFSTLELLNLLLNDEQEGSIQPRADRAAFKLISGMGGPGDADMPVQAAMGWLRSQAAMLAAERPAAATEREWSRMQELRRLMVLNRGCRLYAERLGGGDARGAADAAGILLAAMDDAHTRAALVMTAAAAGHADEATHTRWLDEAAEMGDPVNRAPLREWVAAALAP